MHGHVFSLLIALHFYSCAVYILSSSSGCSVLSSLKRCKWIIAEVCVSVCVVRVFVFSYCLFWKALDSIFEHDCSLWDLLCYYFRHQGVCAVCFNSSTLCCLGAVRLQYLQPWPCYQQIHCQLFAVSRESRRDNKPALQVLSNPPFLIAKAKVCRLCKNNVPQTHSSPAQHWSNKQTASCYDDYVSVLRSNEHDC